MSERARGRIVKAPAGPFAILIHSQAMNAQDSGAPALTTEQIAALVGGRLEGDGSCSILGLASLEDAGPDRLAPLTSRRYLTYLAASRAGALLVSTELAAAVPADRPRIVVDDGAWAIVLLLTHFQPVLRDPAGIHPTAVIGEGVRLADDVGIGPHAVLGDGVDIGAGTRVGAHVVVGRGVRIGRDCTLHPQSVLYPGASLGDRVILHSGARVGADGFGYVFHEGAHRRIPHGGACVIGDDVEIGANSTIDRGSLGDTVLGNGVKIDNLVQIAHNVHVGDHSMMAALVGVAGSTRVGRGVWMGGQAGLINQLDVGDGARIAVATKVFKDVPAGETVSGHPARPHREELRRQAAAAKAPELLARVKALEAEVTRLRAALGS